MLLKFLLAVVAYLLLLAGLGARTWEPKAVAFRRLTPLGWAVAFLGFLTMCGGIAVTASDTNHAKEAAAREIEANLQLQTQLRTAERRLQELNAQLVSAEESLVEIKTNVLRKPLSLEKIIKLAENNLRDGHFRKAMEMYDHAVLLDPRNSYVWRGKALCYVGQHTQVIPSIYESSVDLFWANTRNWTDDVGWAYLSALRALELAETDDERLKANVIVGVTLLCAGETGSVPGPGSGGGPVPANRDWPHRYFLRAWELSRTGKFGDPIGPTGTAFYEHRNYVGLATHALLRLSKDSSKAWAMREFLEAHGWD